jgi:hypothetical protein
MANKMLFDETRALRREQREARIARKRERQEARAVKRQHQADGPVPLALETIAIAPIRTQIEEPASAAEAVTPEPAASPVTSAVQQSASTVPVPSPLAQAEESPADAPRRAPRDAQPAARRERDIAEFLERREQKVRLAREEAKERIARLSEEEAVHDALIKLAHSQASRWRQHRERLCEAIGSRRIPEIGAAARRACRGAANDAARTSRKAPDPEVAMDVAVAYAVIAQAPWAAIRGRRAERSAPTGQAYPRPVGR